MSRNNIVYIGKKPLTTYCMAVLQTLNVFESVKLVARGSAISRAVDVAEVTRNRYLVDVDVQSIEIDTEKLEGMNGVSRNVSSIVIELARKKNGDVK